MIISSTTGNATHDINTSQMQRKLVFCSSFLSSSKLPVTGKDTSSIRKIAALFPLYFACCTEIGPHNKKIFTRFNSLKIKDPWFVKYPTKLFSEYSL